MNAILHRGCAMVSWRMKLFLVCCIVLQISSGCSEKQGEAQETRTIEAESIAKWDRVFETSDPVSDISIRLGVPVERYLRNPRAEVCQPIIPWPGYDDKLKLGDLAYQEHGPFKLEMISLHDETNIVIAVCSSYSLKNLDDAECVAAFNSASARFNSIYTVPLDFTRHYMSRRRDTEGFWVVESEGMTCHCHLRLKNDPEDPDDPKLVVSCSADWRPREKTPEEFCAKLDRLTTTFLTGDVRDWLRPDSKDFYLGRIRRGARELPGSALKLNIKEPGLGTSVCIDKDSYRITYAEISQKFQKSNTKADACERFRQFADFFSQRYLSTDVFDSPCDLSRLEAVRAWVRRSVEGNDLILLGLSHDPCGWSLVCICASGAPKPPEEVVE